MGVKRSRSDTVSAPEDPESAAIVGSTADVKIVHLDTDSARSEQAPVMKCSLPPHQPLVFTSYEDYDVHYQKTHMHRCTECRKNFPDEHFLHLHIAEYHDPLNAAKKDRGEKTYACLLPTCDRLCSTPQKRRLHCIDKHSFPRNYDFFIVNDGIDRRSSMLRPQHRRRSSTLTSTTTATEASGKSHNDAAQRATPEEMDIVGDEKNEGMHDDHVGSQPSHRSPVKLRGRGGFGHGQRGRGRGRGRGTSHIRETAMDNDNHQFKNNTTSSAGETGADADAMEGLASGMSALQFVPHSVRMARGRGR